MIIITSKYQKKLLRAEYMSRINRVQDYIDQNLSEELTLAVLADYEKWIVIGLTISKVF